MTKSMLDQQEASQGGSQQQESYSLDKILNANDKVKNQVFLLLSAKGGSGSTVVAVNFCDTLVRMGKEVCLIDLDLQMGDVCTVLESNMRFPLSQAAKITSSGQFFDKNEIKKHLASGIYLLSQSGHMEGLEHITGETLMRLLESLRKQFDAIVIEGVRDFSDLCLGALDGVDQLIIVLIQDVLAIRRTRLMLSILKKIGFDEKRISLLVNDYQEGRAVPLETIQRVFPQVPLFALPADKTAILKSINKGQPLSKIQGNHKIIKSLQKLAHHLLGEDLTKSSTLNDPSDSILKKLIRWRES